MILAGGALLQQQAVLAVADDHRDGAMAQSLPVRLQLAHRAERPVMLIDEDHLVGGILRAPHHVIFTYSKSPGLLSIPTFGGAIQPANLPGSYCGVIRLSMNSRSESDGRNSGFRFSHSASLRTLPSTSALMLENSPMWRWKPTCGSLIWNGMLQLSITRFQRPTPTLQS